MSSRAPAQMYRGQTVSIRALDLARFRLRRDGPPEMHAAELFPLVRSAATDLEASSEEEMTAFAYVVIALKDERIEQNDEGWPRTRRECRLLLAMASSYAETYDAGSITNVRV